MPTGFFNAGSNTTGLLATDNVDFSGQVNPQPSVTQDGQLLIGSASTPHINVSTLTEGTGISILNGPGTIQISVNGSQTGQTITGNTGGPRSPTGGNWNIVGSGSLTTAGSGSTLTASVTGLTNHNVLVGAGTATITKVAPSATSGVPLISQGSSADPAFGTAVVAGGGTGRTSSTAYAVICGGTTSTAAQQSIASVGSAGQVLTSNGASALPTFQDTLTINSAGTAYISTNLSNLTGDGTDYKIAFDTVLYDKNSDFDTTNHNLVIPTTGYYLLIANATFDGGLTSSYNSARLYISIPSISVYVDSNNPSSIALNAGTTYSGSYIAELNANDLVNAHVVVGGSTKTVGLYGGGGNLQTFFSWHFICPS